MHLACPSCHATYDVPDTLLGTPPRPVRCARCATVFTPPEPAPPPSSPAAAPPAPPPSPVSRPEPRLTAKVRPVPLSVLPEELEMPPAPPSAGAPLAAAAAAWVLSLALLGGAGYAAWHWREEIMAAWPPSQRAYALFNALTR
ncbi:hypothetical protein F1189_06120 [Rhodovastum atsumiense]|uniref:Zinc finger/thioredoxin putative domain-containing protein n=1 Tax=Rhodovastum atsumiense TaxID=504468 RepID=A0A5M6IY43_9PROT|nr:hypothetical protein F1189_06120 [Rhodovastum atsumiense]